jgi:plastocyanin
MSTVRPTVRSASRMGLALVLAGGLLFTACGDDEDDAAAGDTTTESTAEAPSSSEAPAGETVEIELVDYAFEGIPDSVPAGTKITVKNSSTVEFHELVAFKLPDDETRSSEELVNLPEDELGALFAGEPATVLLAGPHGGHQTAAVGDGTLAEPGRYLILCSIPTGADPEEIEASLDSEEPPAEDPDAGPPHFTQGMHAEIIVE